MADDNARRKMTEPQNDMEKKFVALIEDGRRRVFEGPGAIVPRAKRRTILAGIKINHVETGEVICTLADDDYLLRFRAACQRHQAGQ